MRRPDWDEYFLGIADAVSARGECVRSQVGCVLTQISKETGLPVIVATGYNGVAAGEPSCLDGVCPRGVSNVARRSEGGPEVPCIAFHAEDNAISDAYARGIYVPGCTAYLTKQPCPRCRVLLDSLNMRVVWRDVTRDAFGFRSAEGVWTTETVAKAGSNDGF